MYTWLKCYFLEMLSDLVNVIVYYGCINIFWLKCYLSGDALQGSGSQINPIKHHLYCITNLSKTRNVLQLVPVTRIEQLAKRTGV